VGSLSVLVTSHKLSNLFYKPVVTLEVDLHYLIVVVHVVKHISYFWDCLYFPGRPLAKYKLCVWCFEVVC